MVQFEGDKDMHDHPLAVYITLQKEDQIAYSVHADYISQLKRYQVYANLMNLMPQRVNGDYEVVLHVEDPRAEASFTKSLGKLNVDFNEGSGDREYDNIREDYRLYDKIVNYFPPEPEAKEGMVPLVFSGVLLVGLLSFIGTFARNKANLSALSFFGLGFLLTYSAVFFVIIAFWIG